jgi:hypothetical protein
VGGRHQLAALQGLTAQITSPNGNVTEARVPAFSVADGLKEATQGRWEGSLRGTTASRFTPHANFWRLSLQKLY